MLMNNQDIIVSGIPSRVLEMIDVFYINLLDRLYSVQPAIACLDNINTNQYVMFVGPILLNGPDHKDTHTHTRHQTKS